VRAPGRRPRRLAALALLLAVVAVVVPDATLRPTPMTLVKVQTADGVAHPSDVVWILALGSDARPGEPPLRSRADAVQLVALDLDGGRASVLGIPRDSWVPIPGHGSGRVNSAFTYGGPQLVADTVGGLVGVRPDYVFTTTFPGLRAMVQSIGGVTVESDRSFTDPNMAGSIREGRNRLDGAGALFFSRARYALPRGDFDRSANQQELLRGILRAVRAGADRPGFMERGVLSAMRHLSTNVPPRELYRLAHAATTVDPARVRGCVLDASFGTVGGASVVFPDTAQARRLVGEARADATFGPGC
jgi:polyisoprenyl-teichoic acid--peptidoglycan teichoic acid transferase